MKKNDPFFTMDEYEREIEESLDFTKLKSVDNLEEEKAMAKVAAINFFKKDKRINIRLQNRDLINIRKIAEREGLPYQTLIGSILHKYANEHINV